MDTAVHNRLVSFIWSIADDSLRDVYVRGKYSDVILPMVVFHRLMLFLSRPKKRFWKNLRSGRKMKCLICLNY